jgi:hypothetical protein
MTHNVNLLAGWSAYVSGTITEILATLPEVVVVLFLISVNPEMAFITVMVTLYANTLCFSLYSFFLPRNQKGKFVMPKPITEAGTQVLIAGGAYGMTIGMVMLVLRNGGSTEHIHGFERFELVLLSLPLLMVFAVYISKLMQETQDEITEDDFCKLPNPPPSRRRLLASAAILFPLSLVFTYIGGESVSHFAHAMTLEFSFSVVSTAFILAGFAGMSEYTMLYTAHRRKAYGVALANAFGGLIQVSFLLLPIVLLGIAWHYQNTGLLFSHTNILLLIFLFPTFYVLSGLLEEDHTFDLLDTSIMTSIVIILIYFLLRFGA